MLEGAAQMHAVLPAGAFDQPPGSRSRTASTPAGERHGRRRHDRGDRSDRDFLFAFGVPTLNVERAALVHGRHRAARRGRTGGAAELARVRHGHDRRQGRRCGLDVSRVPESAELADAGRGRVRRNRDTRGGRHPPERESRVRPLRRRRRALLELRGRARARARQRAARDHRAGGPHRRRDGADRREGHVRGVGERRP